MYQLWIFDIIFMVMIKMTNFQENKAFRILYFIGIFLIVANHGNGGGFDLLYNWFPAYSFHLGLFIFCSGYFIIQKKDEKRLSFIKKNIFKLLVPLYVLNLLYGLIAMYLRIKGFDFGIPISFKSLFILPIYDGHQFILNLATWFIWPLFILKVSHIFLIKLIDKNKINCLIYFAFSIILGMIGINLAMNGYNYGYYLLFVRLLYFLPFFALGIFYRKVIEPIDRIPNLLYFLIILTISLIVIYIFGGVTSYTPSWCNDFDNIYHPIISGFLAIFFWLRVSKVLEPSLGNSKFVLLVSKNTFSIMVHHLTGFFILNTFYYKLSSKVFTNFDLYAYKHNIFYAYYPKNLYQFGILYVIVGLVFSLLIKNISITIIKQFKKA